MPMPRYVQHKVILPLMPIVLHVIRRKDRIRLLQERLCLPLVCRRCTANSLPRSFDNGVFQECNCQHTTTNETPPGNGVENFLSPLASFTWLNAGRRQNIRYFVAEFFFPASTAHIFLQLTSGADEAVKRIVDNPERQMSSAKQEN
jgi:hypothetical protein